MANSNDTDRMQELGGSGYEIVDGQPNIKGWDVRDTAGNEIGEVDELIFDTQSQKVLYIIVDLDDNNLGLDSKKVLVPIGLATLDEKEDEVILAELTSQKLGSLPSYQKGMITPATESQIRGTFTGLAAAAAAGTATYESHPEGFYNHEHFDDKQFYGSRTASSEKSISGSDESIPIIEEDINISKREVQTGGVRLTSSIKEQAVQENVTLKTEHVHVDRTPVDRLVTPGELDTFKERSIELIEHAEVPVVSKTAVVVEEVSLTKDVTEREEVIKDTVRSTEVEVEDLNSDKTGVRKDSDRDVNSI
ncbi:DUF2382 domain-containing protein [Dyadobacter sediminis]|uniref:DUF2382 domain-containing protein n=2 Tax=Dyadobacter TaxID=120831 RepID=A0A5R9K438_9BACT|nr:PRC and DUF2382 domain-containing protein [Dyadobacter sediminis]TLU88717.1 DUF2382 domain-containing protein [Dyadobacter sediminis]GGC14133.1 hypothetical protein GCM10011325_46330 [Dyadobacter sediminis]